MVRKLTLDEVKTKLRDITETIIIIDDVYITSKTKMNCKCLICNYIWKANWNNLSNNHGCPNCYYYSKFLNDDEIIKKISDEGYEFISFIKRGTANETIIKMKCPENHIYETNFKWFSVHGTRCRRCHNNNLIGEGNYFWNPLLTEEERNKTRNHLEYRQWRLAVYERDNFTCQCCGDNSGGNLNAHHLDSYDWAIDKRLDVTNGLTLCELCHDDFHNLYGYGNNIREHFYEYLKELYGDAI